MTNRRNFFKAMFALGAGAALAAVPTPKAQAKFGKLASVVMEDHGPGERCHIQMHTLTPKSEKVLEGELLHDMPGGR